MNHILNKFTKKKCLSSFDFVSSFSFINSACNEKSSAFSSMQTYSRPYDQQLSINFLEFKYGNCPFRLTTGTIFPAVAINQL